MLVKQREWKGGRMDGRQREKLRKKVAESGTVLAVLVVRCFQEEREEYGVKYRNGHAILLHDDISLPNDCLFFPFSVSTTPSDQLLQQTSI
jgi:hypothetical protein